MSSRFQYIITFRVGTRSFSGVLASMAEDGRVTRIDLDRLTTLLHKAMFLTAAGHTVIVFDNLHLLNDSITEEIKDFLIAQGLLTTMQKYPFTSGSSGLIGSLLGIPIKDAYGELLSRGFSLRTPPIETVAVEHSSEKLGYFVMCTLRTLQTIRTVRPKARIAYFTRTDRPEQIELLYHLGLIDTHNFGLSSLDPLAYDLAISIRRPFFNNIPGEYLGISTIQRVLAMLGDRTLDPQDLILHRRDTTRVLNQQKKTHICLWLDSTVHLSESRRKNEDTRPWGDANFSELISLIYRHIPDAKITVFGSKENTPAGVELSEHFPSIENRIATSTLRETFEIFERADTIITPDGGGYHLATAASDRVIGLVAREDPALFPSHLSKQMIISPTGFTRDISPKEVIHRIKSVILHHRT